MNRHLAKHFAIHLNSLLGQPMHKHAVLDVVFFACRGNSCNPKASKVTLLGSTVTEGILPRLHHLLVGAAKDVLFSAPVTGSLLNNFLVALVAH